MFLQAVNVTTNGTNTTTDFGFLHYFPGGQLQNIVIVMLFIAIALLGVCLIDNTQTHDRFAVRSIPQCGDQKTMVYINIF